MYICKCICIYYIYTMYIVYISENHFFTIWLLFAAFWLFLCIKKSLFKHTYIFQLAWCIMSAKCGKMMYKQCWNFTGIHNTFGTFFRTQNNKPIFGCSWWLWHRIAGTFEFLQCCCFCATFVVLLSHSFLFHFFGVCSTFLRWWSGEKDVQHCGAATQTFNKGNK